jgi:hypothetical protein
MGSPPVTTHKSLVLSDSFDSDNELLLAVLVLNRLRVSVNEVGIGGDIVLCQRFFREEPNDLEPYRHQPIAR